MTWLEFLPQGRTVNKEYIYTYIIGHYNPSDRIIDLVSHTTYVVCVILYISGENYSFKVDSEQQIYWETFSWPGDFTFRVFARNLLRGNRRRYTFRILLWCLVWGSNTGFSKNKPTHYLLHYGDYKDNRNSILKADCEELWNCAQNCEKTQSWILHHDNAPAHTSMLVREFLAKHKTVIIP